MRFCLVLIGFLSFFVMEAQSTSYKDTVSLLSKKAEDYWFSNQDSAYYYLESIKELAIKEKDSHNIIWASLDICDVASYHFNLSRFQKNLLEAKALIKNLNPEEKYFSKQLDPTINLLYYQGDYYYKLRDYERSKNAFQKILSLLEKQDDSIKDIFKAYTSVSYSYIGKIHLNEGKYNLAEELYENNIRDIQKSNPDNKSLLYDNYNLLAELYKKQGRHIEANNYLLRTLDYHIEKGHKNSTISSSINVAQNYLNQSLLDSADIYLKIAERYLHEKHPRISGYHQVRSELFEKKGEYSHAQEHLKKALNSVRESFKNRKHHSIASYLNKIGELNSRFNRPQQALEAYSQGIREIEQNGSALAQVTLLKLLSNQSQALNTLNSPDTYNKVINNTDLGVKLLDSLRPSFKVGADKLSLIEDSFPLFESGLESLYEKHLQTNDKDLLEKVFYFMEKSKAVLLLEVLMEAKATRFADIPEALLERELLLKSQIAYTEKRINRLKQQGSPLKDKLFLLKEDYRSLSDSIETLYPVYYNLKYNNDVISLSQLQSQLNSGEILVSFFFGQKHLYALATSGKKSDFIKIPVNDQLIQSITQVRKMVSDPKSDSETLNDVSYHLYTRLLRPFIQSREIQRMIVIPDGPLYYIPFGALNTNKNKISYLIESTAITYITSATLLNQLKEYKDANNLMMGVAPVFSSSDLKKNSETLLPLAHNVNEVDQLLKLFDGDTFINQNATLSNFTNNSKQYGVLHLATHAKYDDTNPEYSYLAFTPKENEDHLLYVRDLYQMNFNASLITLSACETGIGTLKKGEGFIGLTRGFFYSGVPAIASTLWNVNDASAANLMQSFYKNLSTGDQKDIALQKAKITFLKSNSQTALSHPYYWSGFVFTGNAVPITGGNNIVWWILIIGIAFALGVLFWLRRKV